jgi:two-component system phosphate regulon sensor histidine kinase PhoR
VDDLLTLSRLEGSPLPGQDHWIALGPLLARCEADARSLAAMSVLDGQPSHDLHFDFPEPVLRRAQVDGSFNELASAFSNLLSNAIRYTPNGGAIHVAWRTAEGGAPVFEVSDSGPGIAPEHLPRLTERFYRVDQSRSRQTGGTGLGLAIVKHVVQRHGARLLISSSLGKGSTFAIELPAARYRMPAGGA